MVSGKPLVALALCIVGHSSVDNFSIVTVEVVSIYRINHILCCVYMLTTQASSLLCGDGGGGGLSTLEVFLVIPGYHIIFIILPPLPLVPSGRNSTPFSATLY